MSKNDKVLLLVGSPKSSSSTSNSLGDYLISHLEQLSLTVDKEYIYKLIRKEDGE